MKKITNVLLITTVSFMFTGCTSSSLFSPEKSESFKLGETDGCATATGDYTKNSDAFNMDADYKNGWFHGRKNCNPVQSLS